MGLIKKDCQSKNSPSRDEKKNGKEKREPNNNVCLKLLPNALLTEFNALNRSNSFKELLYHVKSILF